MEALEALDMLDMLDEEELFEGYPEDLHFERCQGRPEDVLKMKEILEKDPTALERIQGSSDASKMTFTCITPLQDACMLGHILCVEFLLQAGANVNEQGFFGDGALQFAWQGLSDNMEDCLKICKILLEKGATPNYTTPDKMIRTSHSLILAAHRHENEALFVMLEQGALPQDMVILESGKMSHSLVQYNPLSSAIHAINVEGFRILLFHGACMFLKNNLEPADLTINLSIPHHIISNYTYNTSTEEILKAFNVYQQFGGSLWLTDTVDGQQNVTAIDVLRNNPQLKDLNPGLEEELDKMMKKPLSLKCITRLRIKNIMGLNYWKKIKQLEIPPELQHFLQYHVTGDYERNQVV